jgi:hypothetical protein
MQIRGKIGSNESMLSTIVPVVIILLFFIPLLIWVTKATTSGLVIEELYAKKIGLIIETGLPGLEVEVDIKDICDYWVKNKIDMTNFRETAIIIDKSNNLVSVRAGKSGGYSYPFVNERDFTATSNCDSSGGSLKLIFANV